MHSTATLGFILCLLIILIAGYISVTNAGGKGLLYSDYGKFYQSARFVLEGKDAYTPIYFSTKSELITKHPKISRLPGNLNPPFFSLLLLPLAFFSYKVSFYLWSALSILCGIGSLIILLQKTIISEKNKWVTIIFSLLAFVTYYPTFANAHFGQLTLFLLPLTVGAWLAIREEKPELAAVLLGLAASIKLFFGLFGIYFLLRREWRALVWFSCTIFICFLLPLLIFGPQVYVSYFETLHYLRWTASSWNASILGTLLRLFGGNHEPNIALVPIPGLTEKIYLFLSGLCLLCVSWFIVKKTSLNKTVKRDFDFCMILIAMLLLSPLGWLYYFPLLIIPIIVLMQLAKEKYYPVAIPVFIGLVIIFSSLPLPLIASGWINATNVSQISLSSGYYTGSLLLSLITLFFLDKKLATYDRNNSKPLSQRLLMGIFIAALLPSLIGIIRTTTNLYLYGNHFLDQYTLAYFG